MKFIFVAGQRLYYITKKRHTDGSGRNNPGVSKESQRHRVEGGKQQLKIKL